MTTPLPQDRPIFSFYGDDFTGSTDALEALAVNGLPAVLFLRPPGATDLARFGGCRALGIAGESRSRTPQWMRQELPPVFHCLRKIGAPIVQYKVCSTFDSSPEIGSIGCAIEIGQQVFGSGPVGVVAAAPLLERYVVFGNLFAMGGNGIHRIDRHPAMRKHPTTPMDEGDLLRHLGRQTRRRLAGVNLLELREHPFGWPTEAEAVLFDGLEPADMVLTAQLIWEHRATPQTFVAGSSGFTYGLMDYWRSQGWLPQATASVLSGGGRQERILVLAGSCSPATEAQIRSALRSGFCGIRLHPREMNACAAEREAVAQLSAGRSVILYTALGPADRVEIDNQPALGAAMGRLLCRVILASGVRRVVVAGGDTSSHAARELGITALTFLATLARGAPLCLAHGWQDHLELVLKGGQIGSESFFEEVLSWT
ncbi:MAG TPA: four-carbon acid sugar kinase family protein [Bryobacteraceae bacterium]|nr:four-carbon acid sugar kinase family protein [Bryobacteraceae bacterium]